MTTILALTDPERAIVQDYADGNTVVDIARDHAMPVSAVRALLHRACNFDQRRAQLLLAGAFKPETPPQPAEPTPPELEPAPAPEAPPERPNRQLPAAISIQADIISYRMLDYWTTRGYIQADTNSPGSGRSRRWSKEEQDVARLMARLTAAGLTVMAAHHAARHGLQLLDPGVRIILDDDTAAA